ncbi:MAG: hypothetical protein K8R21_10695 [Leptospira sp.]|nr:hypothetical protein [Leptospira sp.]
MSDTGSAILTRNLLREEINFLNSLSKLYGSILSNWSKNEKFNGLSAREILLIENFTFESLSSIFDWAIDPFLIGRFSEQEKKDAAKSGIAKFWDLENYSIQDFPWKQNFSPTENSGLIFAVYSDNFSFSKITKSILRSFGISPFLTTNFEELRLIIEGSRIDCLILDWDTGNFEPVIIHREFTKIRRQGKFFPPVIGIKDFNKPDLFKSLSSGIRDFSPFLFSQNEVIKLLINSMPLSKPSEKASEKPFNKFLNWDFSPDRHILSYNLIESEKDPNIYGASDFENRRLRSSFEWLFSSLD